MRKIYAIAAFLLLGAAAMQAQPVAYQAGVAKGNEFKAEMMEPENAGDAVVATEAERAAMSLKAAPATGEAYYYRPGTPERKLGMDFLWFLWAGRNSPIFGRDRMTTFERRLITDESAWLEPKNAYYTLYQDPAVCDFILREFGLEGPHCHIINGHVPVKAKKGESPIKGGGKLLVIDGGFCKAYQSTSGIAGYTLISTSQSYRIVAHQPFVGREKAIRENYGIAHSTEVFERQEKRQRIMDTDIGRDLQMQINDLRALVSAYRAGAVKEDHKGS